MDAEACSEASTPRGDQSPMAWGSPLAPGLGSGPPAPRSPMAGTSPVAGMPLPEPDPGGDAPAARERLGALLCPLAPVPGGRC